MLKKGSLQSYHYALQVLSLEKLPSLSLYVVPTKEYQTYKFNIMFHGSTTNSYGRFMLDCNTIRAIYWSFSCCPTFHITRTSNLKTNAILNNNNNKKYFVVRTILTVKLMMKMHFIN